MKQSTDYSIIWFCLFVCLFFVSTGKAKAIQENLTYK